MTAKRKEIETDDERPLTASGLVKWGSVVVGAGTILVACLGSAYSTKGDVQLIKVEQERHARDIGENKAKNGEQDRIIIGNSAKLDYLVEGLKRVEAKVDKLAEREAK